METPEKAEQHLPAVVTADTVKMRMNLQLTKNELSYQLLANKAATYVAINEDQVDEAALFIDKIKKAKKKIEDVHTAEKAPHLEASRACDKAKNDMLASFDAILSPVQTRYNKVKADIHAREVAEAEKKRVKQAHLDLIEAKVIEFSQKAAACGTKKELVDVERLINLEKNATRASTYGEEHEILKQRLDEAVLPVVRAQKPIVEQKELLASQIVEAENAGDIDKMEELTAKHEQVANEVLDNSMLVQENVLHSYTGGGGGGKVTQVMPTAKPKRTDIEVSIVDEDIAYKKARHLLKVEIKTLDAITNGKQFLNDKGTFDGADEKIVNGILYKIKRTW